MNTLKKQESNDIQKMVDTCEELCDTLRMMRRKDPNKFFDSPEEKLLKNMEGTLTGYYRGQVDEPREVMKLKQEIQRMYHLNNELERELADYKPKEN